MRSKNKTSKTYLKWRARVDYHKALKDWSKLVQTRDGHHCVICLKTEHTQAHHILDKRYYKQHSLDVGIGISLCINHHKWGPFAAHTNALWFINWVQNNRPEQYQYCLNLLNQEQPTP